MTTAQDLRGRLWSDEPSKVDFLAARAIAETVSDAVLDDALDPVAIGLSGPWGSGKTTVLELIKADLDGRSDPEDAKILTVRTDPWRYDPVVGAKESLIGDVLDAIADELKLRLKGVEESKTVKIKKLLKKLTDRIDWAKAVKVAAKSSLTLQLPGIDDVLGLIREPVVDGDGANGAGKNESRGLAGFKAEFEKLIQAEELAHVRRVAVLVDDLDRCLVDTVVETLEAIRLFLSVEGIAFVIAADEDRVAEAIRTRLPEWSMPADRPGDEDALPAEPPSKLYLHKIVQTTVPLPALGAFDTESYVLLLQLQNRIDDRLTDEQLSTVITECQRLRSAGALDDLKVPKGLDVQRELAFARRLTTILYEKLRGNPRRIKRFLNDLNIRRSIAARRGIELDYDVVAKLMVLEVLLPEQFQSVLSWLRTGELRERLETLERQANRPKEEPGPDAGVAETSTDGDEGPRDNDTPATPATAESASSTRTEKPAQKPGERPEAAPPTPTVTVAPHFVEDMIRWAKLPPDLHDLDLSPYLHLAASFRGDLLVSAELPQHLRDLAAQLASTRTVDRIQPSDKRLQALNADEVSQLIRHLSLRARDRVQEQRGAVRGIVTLSTVHAPMQPAALDAFSRLPASDLQPGTAIILAGVDFPGMKDVVNSLAGQLPEGQIKKALTTPPPKGGQN